MKCGYQCHEIGGPWISENPECPVHGIEAQREEKYREQTKEQLYQQIHEAKDIEDLRLILYSMVEMI
jgi:hypothetical protein